MKKQLKANYEAPKANITYFAFGEMMTDTSVPGIELPDDEFSLRKFSDLLRSWVNTGEE